MSEKTPMPKTPKDNSMKPATLWLRVGDVGSYEPFDQDLDADWHAP